MAGYLGAKPAVNGIYTVDEFTSSGGTTYTLSRAPGTKNNIQVNAGGLAQYPSAYSVSGTTLTLSGVPSGQKVVVRHMGETILYPALDDGIVTSAKIAAGAVGTTDIADDAVSLAKMASGTDGNIITYDASGNPAAVATGTAGQILTSAGAGAPPTFAAAPGGGIVKQVVQNHVDTASSQSLSAATITNISNLSASITPTSSSSKILVAVRWNGECTATQDLSFGLKRGGTDVGYATAYSSAPRCIATASIAYHLNDDSTQENAYFEYIDSPATASAVTYYATARHESGVTIYHNRCVSDGGGTGNPRATSSITLTELTSATTQLNGS